MTWKIKHKRLQTVISVTRNQEAKAESSPAGRGGRCLRKLSRKGEEGPKAAKSHRKRILSRRNSRCHSWEASRPGRMEGLKEVWWAGELGEG